MRKQEAKLGLAVVLGAVAATVVCLFSPDPARAQAPGADIVARGKYLATMGDCAACHTAPGGKMFAGGLYMNTPVGQIPTPNITPDKETGIGNYTDDDFYRVLHEGIAKGDKHLYPAMPYAWYTHVTRDDVLAIKAYLFTVPPVHAPKLPLKVGFPFDIRAGMAAWNAALLHTTPFKPDPAKSALVNRGAYIVGGLEHCGECHNGVKLLGDTAAALPLQGGVIDDWYAPDITSDPHHGIGRYSDDDLFTYLKTGVDDAMGVVVGSMSQTQHESLSQLTDDDLHAIVAYIKSTPPKPGYQGVHLAAYAAAATPGSKPPGAEAYDNFCSSCHQQNGLGKARAIPALAANGVVIAGGPENIIRVVLGGIEAQGSYSPMPAIGARMTDAQVADVANYIRQSWGNDAPANAGAGEVGKIRGETHTLLNQAEPGHCPSLAQPDLARAINDPANGIKDTMMAMKLETIIPSVDTIVGKIKAAVPNAAQADIVNSLTIAYCPIVAADTTLSGPDRVTRLDSFAVRAYTQLATGGRK